MFSDLNRVARNTINEKMHEHQITQIQLAFKQEIKPLIFSLLNKNKYRRLKTISQNNASSDLQAATVAM